MSFLDDLQYYQDLESDEGPWDIFTAASMGEICYFLKNRESQLPSSLSISNDSGWTPLMYACSRGHDVLVYHLLHYGASKKCKSKTGVTPLMLAISSGDFTTFEHVFDVDDMESKDDKSWTPLFYAVHFNRQKCLEFLLRKGAIAGLLDGKNETPLMLAIRLGNETTIEMLLKAREKANVRLDANETLITLAAMSNNQKIFKLVSDHCNQLDKENRNLVLSENYKLLQPGCLNRLEYSPSPSLKINQSPSPLLKVNQMQYSPSPSFGESKKRSLFNFKLNKSYAYSPLKNSKSSTLANLASPQNKSFNVNKEENNVETFLKTLGLEKYWPIFKEEEVDFETMLTLGDHNLKELGISKYGPRRKIYLAVQQLKKDLK